MKKYLVVFALLLATNWSLAQYLHDSIKTERGYLHYYVTGKGKPIVHLQGGPGFSSYYMRGIADSLPGYQNILIDYQGTGRSQYQPADSSWVNIDNIIDDVELVRKKLNIGSWTALGHSYGGMFALHYAVKFPKYVNKVITVGGAGTNNRFQIYFSDNLHAKLTEAELLRDNQLMQDTTGSDKDNFYEGTLLHMPGYFYDRKKIDAFMNSFPDEEMKRLMNPDFMSAYTSSPDFMKYDIGSKVYALELPVRLIQGRQDPVGEAVPVLINERSKNSKLYFVEQTSHFPWIEQPQDFFKILLEYLET